MYDAYSDNGEFMNLLKIMLKKTHLYDFFKTMYYWSKGNTIGRYKINWILKKYSDSTDPEESRFVLFCKKNKKLCHLMYQDNYSYFFIFANDFVLNYIKKKYEINYYDGMPYVSYRNKRLFMPKEWSQLQIIKYVRGIDIEQDKNSPHCYFPNSIDLTGKVLVDVGGAEGNFVIEYIDSIKYLYIFEADKKWITPLRYTFRPWKSKVRIIEAFVGDGSNNTVSLDSYLVDEKKIDYIKMDVEGAECDVIKGAKNIISNHNELTLFVCLYHYDEQENDVRELLFNKNFIFRRGKMFFLWDKKSLNKPLRHCVAEINNYSAIK